MSDKEIYRLIIRHDKFDGRLEAHGYTNWRDDANFRVQMILPLNGLYRSPEPIQIEHALGRLSHEYIKHISELGFKEVYKYD